VTDPAPNPSDPGAFVRLLAQHERRIYGYILGLVGNFADADEIRQDVSVRLWEQFDRFEPASDFAAWAISVAHYEVLTFRRRAGRAKVMFSQAFVDTVADELVAAAPDADARADALGHCLKRLSETNQQMIAMVYEGSMPVAKVAEALGRSTDAIYKALQRAYAFLHDCITETLKRDRD